MAEDWIDISVSLRTGMVHCPVTLAAGELKTNNMRVAYDPQNLY